MIKTAASLFTDILFRPSAAIDSLLHEETHMKPAVLLFAAYAASGALISSLMPPSFMPEIPPSAFGQPYAVYIGVALPAGLLLNALTAAALPWAAAFFSAGRVGPRVLVSIVLLGGYFLSFAAAARGPALAVIPVLAPPAAAAAAYLRRRGKFRPYFSMMLAFSVPGLALAPAELIGIAAGAKWAYEAAMLAAALWTLWLVVKALKSDGCPGTARAAAAAVSTILLFGGMFYGVSLLLPGKIGPLLMLV